MVFKNQTPLEVSGEEICCDFESFWSCRVAASGSFEPGCLSSSSRVEVSDSCPDFEGRAASEFIPKLRREFEESGKSGRWRVTEPNTRIAEK